MNILPTPAMVQHPGGQFPFMMTTHGIMPPYPFKFPQVSMKALRLRKGKWLPAEETYARLIIRDFKRGYLKRAPRSSTTLRAYLSEELRCEPMRITKKFAGDSSIGKHSYVAAADRDSSEVTHAHKELIDAEKAFKLSCKVAVLEQRSKCQISAKLLAADKNASPAQQKTLAPQTSGKSASFPLGSHPSLVNQLVHAMGPLPGFIMPPPHRLHAQTASVLFGGRTPLPSSPSHSSVGKKGSADTSPPSRTVLGELAAPMKPKVEKASPPTRQEDTKVTSAYVSTAGHQEGCVLGRKRTLDGEHAPQDVPKVNKESPSEAECSLLLDFITSVQSRTGPAEAAAARPLKAPKLETALVAQQ